jgi:hypothetical protein
VSNYAVFLQGQNFKLEQEGSSAMLGFFVTVCVEAKSEEEASDAARKAVQSDPKLAAAFQGKPAIQPSIAVEVVHLLTPEINKFTTGYTFFPMDEG